MWVVGPHGPTLVTAEIAHCDTFVAEQALPPEGLPIVHLSVPLVQRRTERITVFLAHSRRQNPYNSVASSRA